MMKIYIFRIRQVILGVLVGACFIFGGFWLWFYIIIQLPQQEQAAMKLHFDQLEKKYHEGKAKNIFFVSSEFVRVFNATSGMQIISPLVIRGEARGIWFFEGSFPLEIRDLAGNLLGQGIAQATNDWMTENFVPFSAHLEFQKGNASSGIIIFKKDNPSGDIKNDNQFILPIQF